MKTLFIFTQSVFSSNETLEVKSVLHPYMEIPPLFLYGIILAFLIFISSLILFWFWDSLKQKKKISFTHKNKKVLIFDFLYERDGFFYYQVTIEGEIWKAQSHKKYEKNQTTNVLEHNTETMTLTLE